MPVTQYPNVAKPRAQTPSNQRMESGDRVPKNDLGGSLSPLKRRPKKQRKTVRWASGVVDNEYKMRSRPRLSPNTQNASTLLPHSQLALGTTTRTPIANTAVKIIAPSLGPSEDPSRHHQKPSPPKPSGPPRPQSQIPPHVPDAPRLQKSKRQVMPQLEDPIKIGPPPKAPRPARLPTPDLEPVDPGRYFPMEQNKKATGVLRDPRSRPIHNKMESQCKSPGDLDTPAIANQDSGKGEGVYEEP